MNSRSENLRNPPPPAAHGCFLRRSRQGLLVLAQALLTVGMVTLGLWVRFSVGGLLGLGLLGVIGMGGSLSAARASKSAAGGSLLASLAALTTLGSLWLERKEFDFANVWDGYFAVMAGMAALIWWATEVQVEPKGKWPWRLLTLSFAFGAGALWLGASYAYNQRLEFYGAWALLSALIILTHAWLRLPTAGRLCLNTVLLLGVVLPMPDLFRVSDKQLEGDAEARREYYSYTGARKDPTAFARWWDFYLKEWAQTEKVLVVPDPGGDLPYRLKPNARSVLMQCPISINSLGFRGKEILRDKGDAYRIVALGESTTFGITLGSGDRPWPELLEELIALRLRPGRRVEVINAGVFGYTLANNLHRLASEILPLKPDMIISYHGINGFPRLYDALPPKPRSRPPPYQERPVRLLADCEYRLKMLWYRRAQQVTSTVNLSKVLNPMDTAYARDYEGLVRMTQTNHIRLALANYSMAVNQHSDPEVVRFYQAGYPTTPWLIKANAIHSVIVHEIVRRHPEVRFIDTQRLMDGHPENFIDLVHFAPRGEREMAEVIYDQIRDVLEDDLLNPAHRGLVLGNRPRRAEAKSNRLVSSGFN